MALRVEAAEQREDARYVLLSLAEAVNVAPGLRIQAASALLQDILSEEVLRESSPAHQ